MFLLCSCVTKNNDSQRHKKHVHKHKYVLCFSVYFARTRVSFIVFELCKINSETKNYNKDSNRHKNNNSCSFCVLVLLLKLKNTKTYTETVANHLLKKLKNCSRLPASYDIKDKIVRVNYTKILGNCR